MSPWQRLLELLKVHSYRKQRVTLASGKESDFFIDCKQTILGAEGHALTGEILYEAVQQLRPCHAVAGVELGGCPLASAVSLTSFLRDEPLDAIYVRKEVKDHGSRRTLEGDVRLPAGARVVLLEDVITTGGSTLKAVAKLTDAGHTVAGVVVLVDRLEGGREAIEAAGLTVRAIYTRTDFDPSV
ncbi:orotate phosphoribosyltransferase [Pendulispora albinea]|uniref:Orotate phosphoribosyltransferase n=1 Tax=Pendulispora albinea TaxID=2741071 RepID=A0ABZ2LZ84_9BACT